MQHYIEKRKIWDFTILPYIHTYVHIYHIFIIIVNMYKIQTEKEFLFRHFLQRISEIVNF